MSATPYERLDALLTDMPDIDTYTLQEGDGAIFAMLCHAENGYRDYQMVPLALETITAHDDIALENIIRRELGWPEPEGFRATWRYLVTMARGIDERWRDKPWLAVPPSAILAAHAEIERLRGEQGVNAKALLPPCSFVATTRRRSGR